MAISSLTVTGLRNLKPVMLSFSPQINIFYGENGSGKTSLLEAIYFLGFARSFRSYKMNTIINYQQNDCTVFAEVVKTNQFVYHLGIKRSKQGEIQIKVNGQFIRTLAQLADILPLQIINPDSFQLLDGTPKLRRQFIDWGVFHTQPQFLTTWQHVQKSLKQRNAWLKQRKLNKKIDEIASWDDVLCKMSHQLDEYRQYYIKEFNPIFQKIVSKLLNIEVELTYYRGWDKDKDLKQILIENQNRDIQLAHTQAGPQRADLKLKIDGYNAVDILSRGQQKLVICALKIAQGYLIDTYKKGQMIYLIDDLTSELDEQHRKSLCMLLEELTCQIFITGIEKETLTNLWNKKEIVLFHVEHGDIFKVI